MNSRRKSETELAKAGERHQRELDQCHHIYNEKQLQWSKAERDRAEMASNLEACQQKLKREHTRLEQERSRLNQQAEDASARVRRLETELRESKDAQASSLTQMVQAEQVHRALTTELETRVQTMESEHAADAKRHAQQVKDVTDRLHAVTEQASLLYADVQRLMDESQKATAKWCAVLPSLVLTFGFRSREAKSVEQRHEGEVSELRHQLHRARLNLDEQTNLHRRAETAKTQAMAQLTEANQVSFRSSLS